MQKCWVFPRKYPIELCRPLSSNRDTSLETKHQSEPKAVRNVSDVRDK